MLKWIKKLDDKFRKIACSFVGHEPERWYRKGRDVKNNYYRCKFCRTELNDL